MNHIPRITEIRNLSETKRWGYEHILDYFANYIVQLSIFFHATPTQLTFFWVIIQFLTPFLFLKATHAWFIFTVVLFQFLFIIDLSDGKLARYYQITRKEQIKPLFPKYLDRMGHFLNNSMLFLLLGIGMYIRFNDINYIFVGGGITFFFLANKALSVNPAWYKSESERSQVSDVFLKSVPRFTNSKMRQFIFDFLRVEHLFNFLFVGVVIDLSQYVLWFYLVFFGIEFIRKIWTQGIILWRLDQENK